MGRFLGIILFAQIFSGLFLTFFYSNSSFLAFSSVDYIMREVNCGWFLRLLHFNGASLFFFVLYLHVFKAFFYSSYRIKGTWLTGLFMLLLTMAVAFLGYVLVWAQIRYWAAVVITSLISVLPSGSVILLWVWGGYSVGTATLGLFYTLHFLLPWFLLIVVVLHLFTLHFSGRTSLLYYLGFLNKGFFSPYYIVKDFYNFFFFFVFLVFLFLYPFFLGDPEMFVEANNLVSPVHILPEWYFNWAYGILRSIPNKALGVLALVGAVALPFFLSFFCLNSSLMTGFNKYLVFFFVFTLFILSWLGQCPAEEPFVGFGFYFSLIYFLVLFVTCVFIFFTDIIFKLCSLLYLSICSLGLQGLSTLWFIIIFSIYILSIYGYFTFL